MKLLNIISAAAFASVTTLAFAASVDAHAHLLSAVPAENKMAMPPPKELILKFSEALNITGTSVEVVGPDGKKVEIDSQAIDPKNPKAFVVELKAALGDGKYKVNWRALSTDGDGTNGSYTIDSMN